MRWPLPGRSGALDYMLQDGCALVADFGIALAASNAGSARMTETGMSLGTAVARFGGPYTFHTAWNEGRSDETSEVGHPWWSSSRSSASRGASRGVMLSPRSRTTLHLC